MLKKIMTFLLVVVLLCSVSITGFAADDAKALEKPPEIGTRMTYIQNAYTNLSIASGLSTSSATIYAFPGVDSVRISMYLQRYSGGSWTTVKHWAQDFSGTYGSLYKSRYVTSGYYYRVKTYFYAYDGGSSESTSRTTGSVYY